MLTLRSSGFGQPQIPSNYSLEDGGSCPFTEWFGDDGGQGRHVSTGRRRGDAWRQAPPLPTAPKRSRLAESALRSGGAGPCKEAAATATSERSARRLFCHGGGVARADPAAATRRLQCRRNGRGSKPHSLGSSPLDNFFTRTCSLCMEMQRHATSVDGWTTCSLSRSLPKPRHSVTMLI